MAVYSLTDLTGTKRNDERRTVILNRDVNRRTFRMAILSAVVALPVLGVFALFLGFFVGLVAGALSGLVLFMLLTTRQRGGLQLWQHQAILNAYVAGTGVLYVRGQPLNTPRLVDRVNLKS